MKIREILLGIALTLGCSACNDWLTVQPETVVLKEDACGTDAGVKQVLSGMYYTMRSILYNPEGALGGGSGLSESLACTWYATGERAIALANHDYHASDGVESVLNMTFRTFYDVIAMANDLVEGVEKNKDRLSTSVYNIGMGEALAIRALCHLDLIRLWGPMPAYVDASKKYLPYVTVNSTANYEYLTYDKYMGLLLEDLNRAEEFLQKSDPVVTGTFESTEMSNAEWSYRKSRINYYGVLGLQARARLWFGDKEGALNYARMVIDAKNEDGTQKVRLTNGTDDFPAISTTFPWLRNWNACGTYYSEHLCGIKCDVEGYYSVEDYNSSWNKRGVSLVIDRDVNKQAWEELYNENVDIRYVLWQRDANAAYAQKLDISLGNMSIFIMEQPTKGIFRLSV